MLVVEASFDWDDVGSWTRSRSLSQTDEKITRAIVRSHDDRFEGQHCFQIRRAANIALLGVHNLIIVRTDDSIAHLSTGIRRKRSRTSSPNFRRNCSEWTLLTDETTHRSRSTGRRVIGFAISDEFSLLAHPAETFPGAEREKLDSAYRDNRSRKKYRADRSRIAAKYGWQFRPSAARRHCNLRRNFEPLSPVRGPTWDERLTTVAANRALREAGRTTRTTRGQVDQVAAQMILQGYLDSLEHNQGGAVPDPFA